VTLTDHSSLTITDANSSLWALVFLRGALKGDFIY
jgi:hypothetical protein